MADAFATNTEGLNSPALNGFSVTPSATVDFDKYSRAVYVGGAGDLVVILAGDTASITFKNVPAGSILPIRVKRVLATSTATFILGLY